LSRVAPARMDAVDTAVFEPWSVSDRCESQ
jgi:hypothetical protein